MRRDRLFWGGILIAAGVLLLLSNLGLLPVDAWSLLWPLFLIALGVQALAGYFFRRSPSAEHAAIPIEGAAQARVKLNHGAGRLDVHSGAGPGELLAGSFAGGVEVDTQRTGEVLQANLRIPPQAFPFFGWPSSPMDWDVSLSSQVPLSLSLETGANDSHLDLSDLLVTDLHLKSGASKTRLIMPAQAGFTRARVESGAASISIHIPEGTEARIRARGGLSSINVDASRFQRSGSYYQSAGYEGARNRAEIDIDTGVASVEVR